MGLGLASDDNRGSGDFIGDIVGSGQKISAKSLKKLSIKQKLQQYSQK